MYGFKSNDNGLDFSDILISKRNTQEYMRQHGLKKNLTPSHLWGICVGAVISGQFIGWNKGLNFVNPLGLISLTVAVSIFYIILISVMTKLSNSLPYVGGSYAYSRKAFGKLIGFIAGYITMVEYLCITSVIFIYMNMYIQNMLNSIWANFISIIIFGFLMILQIMGIKRSSFFQLLITCLCVSTFLMFFMGINSVENTKVAIDSAFANGVPGFFLAIPYVLWFFVGIDVVILTAEEIRSPGSSVTKIFYSGLITIIVLSFGVIFFSVSSVYWASLKGTDYPLIFVLQKLQGNDAVLLAVFSFFSISSFVASINGMMIGYSRQAFSLARAGYFPKFMDRIHHKTKAPFMALIAASIVAVIIAELGNASVLIQIVCISAIISYSLSLMAFIKVIKIESGASYKTIPAFLGLLFCAVFLAGFIFYQTFSFIITIGLLIIGILYYFVFAKGRINRDAPEEVEANLGDINIIITNL